jgi:hypothetical protein
MPQRLVLRCSATPWDPDLDCCFSVSGLRSNAASATHTQLRPTRTPSPPPIHPPTLLHCLVPNYLTRKQACKQSPTSVAPSKQRSQA